VVVAASHRVLGAGRGVLVIAGRRVVAAGRKVLVIAGRRVVAAGRKVLVVADRRAPTREGNFDEVGTVEVHLASGVVSILMCSTVDVASRMTKMD